MIITGDPHAGRPAARARGHRARRGDATCLRDVQGIVQIALHRSRRRPPSARRPHRSRLRQRRRCTSSRAGLAQGASGGGAADRRRPPGRGGGFKALEIRLAALVARVEDEQFAEAVARWRSKARTRPSSPGRRTQCAPERGIPAEGQADQCSVHSPHLAAKWPACGSPLRRYRARRRRRSGRRGARGGSSLVDDHLTPSSRARLASPVRARSHRVTWKPERMEALNAMAILGRLRHCRSMRVKPSPGHPDFDRTERLPMIIPGPMTDTDIARNRPPKAPPEPQSSPAVAP